MEVPRELYSGHPVNKRQHQSGECTEQGELALLRRISKATTADRGIEGRGVRLGIGDDAALFQGRRGCETILTCDWFLEGTHFLLEKHPAESVGWKCLARAVSDVAAMGGMPRCFLLSLAFPKILSGRWLDGFLRGLWRASRRFGCPLAGGDTTRRREILINVTVVGEVRSGRALLRSEARAGDVIFVSGLLGEAQAGLDLLRMRDGARRFLKNPLLKKHLFPEPRLALGQWLTRERLATAMIDISDGLSSDLPRLCTASGLGARIDSSKLLKASPLLPERFPGIHPLKLALDGGDDYELLFTVPVSKARRVPGSFEGIPLTAVGWMALEKDLVLIGTDSSESPLAAGGWDPFRSKE
jgi:thiamine-monophosphate kinase